MYAYASHACHAQEDQKRMPDPPGARVLRMVLSGGNHFTSVLIAQPLAVNSLDRPASTS